MNEPVRRPIAENESAELPVERLRVEQAAGRRTGCPFHDVRAMLREVGLREHLARLVKDADVVVGLRPVHSNKNHVVTSDGRYFNEPRGNGGDLMN